MPLMEQEAIDRLYKCLGVSLPHERAKEFDTQLLSWLKHYLDSRLPSLSIADDQALMTYLSAPSRSAAFYSLLAHVAEQLTSAARPTLQQITQSLQPRSLPGCTTSLHASIARDMEHDNVIQVLVFKAIGWLTMLYETPTAAEIASKVSIELPMDVKGRPVRSQVINATRNLQTAKDRLPVYLLLKYIGQDLIPCPYISPDPMLGQTSVRPDFFSEQIVVSYVNYACLQKVAKIELEFVPLLSMHLEFDEQTKKLKVFAFPSWCALMASDRSFHGVFRDDRSANEPQQMPYLTSLLRSYFHGYSNREDKEEEEDDEEHVATCDDDYSSFCREILLSYHLLFGHNDGVSALFRNDYHRYLGRPPQTRYPLDSLLQAFSGKSRNLAFFQAGVVFTKQQYSVQKDFPFLGRRLVHLQRFVVEQDPTDWQTLLNDKRDILRFWTFWAVIWIGGLSIVLSLVQVGLTAAQLAVSMK